MIRRCPYCGNMTGVIELASVQRRLDRTIRTVSEMMARDGESLRMQRAKAGMMLREAANLMGIPAAVLSEIEDGYRMAPDEMRERMLEIYL